MATALQASFSGKRILVTGGANGNFKIIFTIYKQIFQLFPKYALCCLLILTLNKFSYQTNLLKLGIN